MAIARALVVDIALNVAKIHNDVTSAKKSFNELRKTALKVASAVAKITAAAYALGRAYEFANQAAKFDQAEQAFTNLSASYGANARNVIKNLDEMAAHTISQADLMASAGKAMLLGIPADKLAGMMEIARSASRITGDSIQKSFEDIATGMGRQSKMILDNLGIIVSVDKANKDYARQLGKTSAELTDAEKKQAFFNATLKAGRDIVNRVNADQMTAAESMQMFAAQVENAKIWVGKAIITITSFASGALNLAAAGLSIIIEKLVQMIKFFVDVAANIPVVGEKFKGLSSSLQEFIEKQQQAQEEHFKSTQTSFAMAEAIWKEKEAIDGLNQARAQDTSNIDQIKSDLEKLEESMRSQEQVIMDSYEKRRKIIEDAYKARIITEEKHKVLLEKIEKDKNDKMAKLGHQGLLERLGLQKLIVYKEALIKAKQSIIDAYQWGTSWGGPPGGVVSAAAAAAFQYRQLSELGGLTGGGGGGGGVGGGATSFAQSPASEQPVTQTQGTLPTQNVTVNVQNGTGDRVYWQSLIEEVIVPGINNAADRNINLTVKTG